MNEATHRPPFGLGVALAERGLVPDALLRAAMRRLCAQRLREETEGGADATHARQRARLDALKASPLAIHPEAANAQHYELPPRFFELCLGRHRKYSCAYFADAHTTLDEAEDAMLALYGERAALANGQRILELGCGWGSLTLWMAERYPDARITAVSNSHAQRATIEALCAERGLRNVRVITEDVNRLALDDTYDRVVSVEMFEHVRNHEALFARIASWLAPEGRLFAHVFCHRTLLYPFETEGRDDWMGRYFFTGGLMPAADTFLRYTRDLVVEDHWRLAGTHYERTANAWLARQDAHRDEILPILAETYGAAHAATWFQRWRMFYMACAELFGYARGTEWLVAHYRFAKR